MKNGVCLKLRGERVFKNFTRAQMSSLAHSVKKTTELLCFGIVKHGNYDLTITLDVCVVHRYPHRCSDPAGATRAGGGSDKPSCLDLTY